MTVCVGKVALSYKGGVFQGIRQVQRSMGPASPGTEVRGMQMQSVLTGCALAAECGCQGGRTSGYPLRGPSGAKNRRPEWRA